ncbi:unnamed protein product [Lepeophtheirus salmonis]|uniref:(salmon louse) hypothetical protein n=1 Tax=Lepeophtheirus salmonis TaxID=72036 RepID=A0A7R8H9N8_LEPSM|nr:unnamed protein product [Lepeophtheirus salmonis]CAF2958384.1 unnamed protein product [Lepeophtheirus salmonis]
MCFVREHFFPSSCSTDPPTWFQGLSESTCLQSPNRIILEDRPIESTLTEKSPGWSKSSDARNRENGLGISHKNWLTKGRCLSPLVSKVLSGTPETTKYPTSPLKLMINALKLKCASIMQNLCHQVENALPHVPGQKDNIMATPNGSSQLFNIYSALFC